MLPSPAHFRGDEDIATPFAGTWFETNALA